MSDIAKIPTGQLVHDYLESYMDIARCELALIYSSGDPKREVDKLRRRLDGNRRIVVTILAELSTRGDMSLFDERELILGRFST